ncbi:peptidoglycan-binding protein [Rathayibacter toxicus]|uniref:Peptidoglycan binding-like domain-containing protein n=2 Tax=Rathayibacter toxicus TaxID=145458 RepID=A0A0U1PTI2_9MICO|nr:peptidoglycan-binding protein [Rathayibacter toxicus]ALS57202.1 hypothetical protein APU90_04985 [Rathayibacter toxicus]KKM45997.1 hypothetical protein VT73_02520 [Rathayibacter toxicus]PPG22924.1 peptidoglycan-binding protein [Rathayibacter toxicus]PPG47505.1 peptidoglycan-binding protein [Rathayibacter toxicus]PPH64377.1 peptidoglycan-binding protein [Rathayibacter toxicus]
MALVVVIVGVLVWSPWSAHNSSAATTAAPSLRTVEVTTGTVAKTLTQAGNLRYPTLKTVTSHATGTITAVPEVGTTISRGDTLYEVDTAPTVLFTGSFPVWRDLSVGMKGKDVLQLEKNLSALGYFSRVPDEEFHEQTTEAVKKWQKAIGVPETGTVAQSAIALAPDEGKIGATQLSVGSAVTDGATVLTLTASTPSVQVMLPLEQQNFAAKDAAVRVTLPDGSSAKGKVTSVGQAQGGSNQAGNQSVGSQSQDSAQPAERSIPVEIALSETSSAGSQEAAVQVAFAGERHEGVLTVPVDALLAHPGGGCDLEVIDDANARRTVPVKLGLVADGVVEISGDGVRDGTTVVAAKE